MAPRIHVSVDHALCVGNGTCLTIAPHVFAHNADRQSEVIDPAGDSEAAILRAAANCPVAAIRVVTETDDRLPSSR
jgi:ferredoxin